MLTPDGPPDGNLMLGVTGDAAQPRITAVTAPFASKNVDKLFIFDHHN